MVQFVFVFLEVLILEKRKSVYFALQRKNTGGSFTEAIAGK